MLNIMYSGGRAASIPYRNRVSMGSGGSNLPSSLMALWDIADPGITNHRRRSRRIPPPPHRPRRRRCRFPGAEKPPLID